MLQLDSTSPQSHLSDARNFALGIAPFVYTDLYEPNGLARLYRAFAEQLRLHDAPLAQRWETWQAEGQLTQLEESNLMLEVASVLSLFLAKLFAIGTDTEALKQLVERQSIIFDFKREFIDKRVRRRKQLPPVDKARYDALEEHLGGNSPDPELRAARCAMELLRIFEIADHRPAPTPEQRQYAAERTSTLLGRTLEPDETKAVLADLLQVVESYHAPRLQAHPWVSYHQPANIDPTHQKLVATEPVDPKIPEAMQAPLTHIRQRAGFALTDKRMQPRQIQQEVHYCLLCHKRGKDSCRHGLRDKAGDVKQSPLQTPLSGCPLDERISEVHQLCRQGDSIAALAMIIVDNPMCPGTGHRICNDCMKACIFQKQEPVNIPEVETGVLSEVLHLPYGFEIYSLLTRFNPLNRKRPYLLPYNGRQTLVVGLGPAGYTLSHYLLNEGFGVVGIDGLKIEPLPDDLTGQDHWPPRALRDYREIEDHLDQRVLGGFGGVAEYGITVRWDKNFLKVIYLTLARQKMFRFFGGIRFGGTVTVEDAWKLGFDHVAIAAGAGRPTVLSIKNNMLRGMRAASDFLMGLQLTGAFKQDALANLQVELPAIVIGGGLTAIDTATEIAAYYPIQITKLAHRVEVLGKQTVLAQCDDEEKRILERMLAHFEQLKQERQKQKPDIAALIRQWGGVRVVYRRGLNDSPAYRLNHEEVQKALEEGIEFFEHLTPTEAIPDTFGHLDGMRFLRQNGQSLDLPARAVMVAAGTSPNTIYERELPGTFHLDARGKFFAPYRLHWGPHGDEPELVPALAGETDAFFTSYQASNRRFVSYYGDNHPRYAGNVVKAMASAKDGYKHVARIFADQAIQGDLHTWNRLITTLEQQWVARIHNVRRLTKNIIEVVVHAPVQAQKFQAGQFFRLQNFETSSPKAHGTRLMMEGLALTGAWVDLDKGLLGMIALEMGVSSRLCNMLRPGTPVVVMGPTGAPTEIPENETVILCGGGLGNAVLFSVAQALKSKNNRVLYFAGYKQASDVYKQDEVEAHSDIVVWSVDHGATIPPRRPQDKTFCGNIVQALQAYADGQLGPTPIDFSSADRILAIGSDRMMAAVTRARKTTLVSHLKPNHIAIASINSPMQCMLKEVCAQCLQRHVDPVTQQESFVFSCFNQDQPQDSMDWGNLAARLRQNTLSEKISSLYLNHLLANQDAVA